MAGPEMSQKQRGTGRLHSFIEDPSASTPTSTFPKVPRPTAQPLFARGDARAFKSGVDEEGRRNTVQQDTGIVPHNLRTASLISRDEVEPTSSAYIEDSSTAQNDEVRSIGTHSKRSKHSKMEVACGDPEKAAHLVNGSRRSVQRGRSDDVEDQDDEDDFEDGHVQENNALRILLFMSGPCVVLSLLNAIWACIALLVAVLVQPLRLCTQTSTFKQQLAGFLAPALRLQLRCIYTPMPRQDIDGDIPFTTSILLIVHFLSTVFSFMAMFAAWAVAVYWLASVVVGDPGGQDKRDDGKESALVLTRWWEWWLLRSVR